MELPFTNYHITYTRNRELTKMASIYEDISSDKSNLTDDSKFISAVVKAFPMLVCIYAHIKVKLMETIHKV